MRNTIKPRPCRSCADLKAKVERLEGALKTIMYNRTPALEEPQMMTSDDLCQWHQEVARQALADDEGEG